MISGLSLLWLRSIAFVEPSHLRKLYVFALPIIAIGIVPYFASTAGLAAIFLAAGMQTRRRVFFTASVWFYAACIAIGMFTFLVGLVWGLLPPSSDLDGPELYAAHIGRAVVMISLIGALLVAAWAGLGLRCCLRSRRQVDATEIKSPPVRPLLNRWSMALVVFGVINFAASHYYNRWRLEQFGRRAADMRWAPDGESLIVGCGSRDNNEISVVRLWASPRVYDCQMLSNVPCVLLSTTSAGATRVGDNADGAADR